MGAFHGCSSLTDIVVDPFNPTYSSLDGVLFNKSQDTLILCPPGKSGRVSVPNTVTNIGAGAFGYCMRLTGVMIPNSVTSIARWAFFACTNLTSLTLPGNVPEISADTFNGCSALNEVRLPGSLIRIGEDAFGGCPSLTGLTIPSSVTDIAAGAFIGCTGLKSVVFAGNPPITGYPGLIFYGADYATIYYLPGTKGWGSSFADRSSFLWNPGIQLGSGGFGVGGDGFGFNITGTPNIPLVVESSSNLNTGD